MTGPVKTAVTEDSAGRPEAGFHGGPESQQDTNLASHSTGKDGKYVVSDKGSYEIFPRWNIRL